MGYYGTCVSMDPASLPPPLGGRVITQWHDIVFPITPSQDVETYKTMFDL